MRCCCTLCNFWCINKSTQRYWVPFLVPTEPRCCLPRHNAATHGMFCAVTAAVAIASCARVYFAPRRYCFYCKLLLRYCAEASRGAGDQTRPDTAFTWVIHYMEIITNYNYILRCDNRIIALYRYMCALPSTIALHAASRKWCALAFVFVIIWKSPFSF